VPPVPSNSLLQGLVSQKTVVRVGHKGAAALAPENTLSSLEQAVLLGCDMVEFDVIELSDGALVLAHSDDLEEVSHGRARGRVVPRTLRELRRVAPHLPTLENALAFLSDIAPGTAIQVDVKAPGYERGVVEALRSHRVIARTLVSSFHPNSLHTFAQLEPDLALALTYPYDRYGLSRKRQLAPVARATLAALRRSLPPRIGGLLAGADASVAMLYHRVVSPQVVERVHALGAAVFAWTVDEEADLKRVLGAGVDGVISNDPRIFGATLTP
jgi:glycerophosphoryl diester phosphodiesterase